jgi:hypothetical protein
MGASSVIVIAVPFISYFEVRLEKPKEIKFQIKTQRVLLLGSSGK